MYTYTAVHEEQLSLAPNDVLIVNQRKNVNGWVKGSKRDQPQKVSRFEWDVMSILNKGFRGALAQ